MKKYNLYFLVITIFLVNSTSIYAESGAIDFLRSTGKIYSVIAVIVVVLLGIAYFLFRIDKKLTKLENQINNEQ